MKKQLILFAALSVTLTGCFQPPVRSMGATLMPAPVMHRSSPDSSARELSVDASGFYGVTVENFNVEYVNALGGNLGVTYRMGGLLSPLFVNVAAGAFAGVLQFGCDESHGCGEGSKYNDWLMSHDGHQYYNFWNFQERALLGADFRFGYLILGAAGGTQLYQGNSKYDDMREKLDDEGLVQNIDEKCGYHWTSSIWLGSYLGRHGQYGNMVAEYDIFYKGGIANATGSIKWTYTHPSGFFGGFARGNLIEFSLFAGKQFVF
ncbi:MAG: hypothetical protein IKP03_01580 [Fibrobacter sp.]|nr:hypothetical protein [Fibrobacter sp.]